MTAPADTSREPAPGVGSVAGRPDATGHFGPFGGRFVPEALVPALDELAALWADARADAAFGAELDHLLRTFVGRPTPLSEARRLGEHAGGARVFLKREDLCHTGSHKLNNALGQALLARRSGKRRVIAETGAGQHGVATATACAALGLQCVVFMGEEDTVRQALNVARMRVLGAEVVPVTSGSRTLKDAVTQALREWVTSVETTHYVIGSAMGPHPYPTMVRDFQRCIGDEARAQVLDAAGRLPDAVVACVGGGSNAAGAFTAFVDDADVALVGVEAGGRGAGPGDNAATVVAGSPGVLHGMATFLLQDEDGQTLPTHSVSAGLDYPGVGPEHAWWAESGRASYRAVDDDWAMRCLRHVASTEGVLPAIETAHAFAGACDWGREQVAAGRDPRDLVLLISCSGRGDKDMDTAARWYGLLSAQEVGEAHAAAAAASDEGTGEGW